MTNRLKEWRERRGLTQEELAERIGSSHTAIQRWESGKRHPRGDNLRKLAEALDCPIRDLFNGPTVVSSTDDATLLPGEIARLSQSSNTPLSDRLGANVDKNSQLILRAVKNIKKQLADISRQVDDLTPAIKKAEKIEQSQKTKK